VRCPECRIEPELHAEIVVALADLVATPAERADMVKTALEADPVPAARREWWIPPAIAAAVLLAIGSLWFVFRPQPTAPAAPTGSGELEPMRVTGHPDDQRQVNDRVLLHGAWQSKSPQDAWGAIAGGRFLGTAPDFPGMLAKADRLAPGAIHRYLFRVGHTGDVTYRSLVDRQMVGLAFLSQIGLKFWEGQAGGGGLFRVEEGRLRMTLEVGWPGVPSSFRKVDVDVVTGFTGPLLLPEGAMEPRFEMPGNAVIRIGPGMKTYPRYVTEVRLGGKTHYVETLAGAAKAARPETAEPPEAPLLAFQWVKIPAGKVLHGNPQRPKVVELDAFEIMQYEVTNQQWWDYLRDERARLKRLDHFRQAVPRHWNWESRTAEFPQVPSGMHDLPVVHVTWYQANDFCTVYLPKKLKCGQAYLPTSAQWEMAARGAGNARRYPWGDEATLEREGVYVFMCNIRETGIRRAVNVTLFPMDESPFGVRGMAGNVSEFVGYSVRNQMAYKGGSFADPVVDAQIHIETEIPPRSTFTWSNVGFRAARFVPE